MKTLLGRMIVGMLPGALASLIAIFIAWSYLERQQAGYENTPCAEKPCYVEMATRMAALEATIPLTTDKRYRSTDAERDLRLMTIYVDKGDRALRDEIQRLRAELNARVDRMHKYEN